MQTELDKLKAENTLLRGLLPAMGQPCVYCGETDMAKCKSGFPGCAQADDLMSSNDETFQRVVKERNAAIENAERWRKLHMEIAEVSAQHATERDSALVALNNCKHVERIAQLEAACAEMRII